MAEGEGRGWHGDPEGHAQAGRQSSGNRKNAGENLDREDRARGGRNSRSGGRKGGNNNR